ncbi:MAG: DNA-directed RNA polymerase subunit delta [Firmicutes bacterium]|nr:DNA-directed RNA polymerase subunit delta [Bacillota bacterium]
MPNIKEQALIDAATRILKAKKEPLEFYELFNTVCGEKEYSDELKLQLITQFYTDISTSAKFVYTGDNMWDLKEHQKTELWEKDGSFYKEYTEIVASDYIVEKVAEPVEVVVEEKPVVVEKPEVIKVEKPDKLDKIDRAKIERVFADKAEAGVVRDEDYVDYDEVIEEEEEDDFDEEKYNEYMDTYEDQYKD